VKFPSPARRGQTDINPETRIGKQRSGTPKHAPRCSHADPNPAPDAIDSSLERVYRLIHASRKGRDSPDRDAGQRRYHSGHDLKPYGLSRRGDTFYAWAQERGSKSPIAVFKHDHLASNHKVFELKARAYQLLHCCAGVSVIIRADAYLKRLKPCVLFF
jgi:hypothetical protein